MSLPRVVTRRYYLRRPEWGGTFAVRWRPVGNRWWQHRESFPVWGAVLFACPDA